MWKIGVSLQFSIDVSSFLYLFGFDLEFWYVSKRIYERKCYLILNKICVNFNPESRSVAVS